MSILEIRTNLNNLKKIAKKVQKVEYYSNYSKFSRMGELSLEQLNAEYKGNHISVDWQWHGKFEDGKGLRDDHLFCVEGINQGIFYYSEPYFLSHGNKRKNKKIRHIASIVKEKYLAQKEKNIEGAVK